MENNTKKVILVDFGFLQFRSIFASASNLVSSTYTAVSILISNLRLIGLRPEDLVIVAIDSYKGNWRKEEDPQYKAGRKKAREEDKRINWPKEFESFRRLLQQLEMSTP